MVGGQIDSLSATDRCEIYDMQLDSWAPIAKLPKPLLSSSILAIQQKYDYRIGERVHQASRSVLFAFGGVYKEVNQLDFCYDIYRIVLGDLQPPGSVPLKNKIWMTLNVQLPSRMCHFGAIQRTNAMNYT